MDCCIKHTICIVNPKSMAKLSETPTRAYRFVSAVDGRIRIPCSRWAVVDVVCIVVVVGVVCVGVVMGCLFSSTARPRAHLRLPLQKSWSALSAQTNSRWSHSLPFCPAPSLFLGVSAHVISGLYNNVELCFGCVAGAELVVYVSRTGGPP